MTSSTIMAYHQEALMINVYNRKHVVLHMCVYRHYQYTGLLLWGAFFEGYKFCEWTKRESSRKQFSRIYISLHSAIHVTIGFQLIFSETNFVEVRKSTITKGLCDSSIEEVLRVCRKIV